jgi:hypothetical protein
MMTTGKALSRLSSARAQPGREMEESIHGTADSIDYSSSLSSVQALIVWEFA